MDELDLDKRIGNKKAHLHSLTGELETVNSRLASLLSLCDEAEARRVVLAQEVDTTTEQLSKAKAALKATHEEISDTLRVAHETHLEAFSLLDEAHRELKAARDEAGKILGTARTDEAVVRASIEILTTEKKNLERETDLIFGTLIEKQEEIERTNASQKQLASDVQETETRLSTLQKSIHDKFSELRIASEDLARVRSENSGLIEGIKRRDAQLKVKEQDNEILRNRLRFIIEEQYKVLKNGHLGTQ